MKRYEHTLNLKDKSVISFFLYTMDQNDDFYICVNPGKIIFVYLRNGGISVSGLSGLEMLDVGDLLTITQNQTAMLKFTKKRSDFFWIECDKALLKRIDLSYATIEKASGICRSAMLDREFSILANEFLQKKASYHTAIISLISNIFVTLIRKTNLSYTQSLQIDTSNKSTPVEQVIDFINSNYNQNLTTGAIAQALNFSSSYLCHIFKTETGTNITSYLNTVRCVNAQRLINSEGVTVAMAAERVGYNNVSYFIKKYKEIIGHSPGKDTVIMKEEY